MRVGVVGAGPAGLTAAAAVQRHAPPGSVEVTVLDRARSVLDYPGVEYGLRARAVRALRRIGLDDVPRRRGHPVSRIEFHDERLRRPLVLPADPRLNVGVLRREFLADLAGAVGVPVLRGRAVTGLSAGAGGAVRVHLDDGHDPLELDLLVAADGARSAVRRACHPDRAVVHDRGFSIVYALADGRDRAADELPPGFAATAGGRAVRFVRGAAATTAWFPAGDRRLTVALGFDHAARDRLWTESGLEPGTPWADVPGPVRHALARRVAAGTPGRDGVLEAALDLVRDWSGPDTYLWVMRDSDPLPEPWSATLPVVLLGDAAHAFLPTIGMGASLAIEDAEALGALVGRHLRARSGSLRADVLVPFGRARYPVWRDLMGRARAAAANWRHDRPDQGLLLSPYVPTRAGSSAVRAYERWRGRAVA